MKLRISTLCVALLCGSLLSISSSSPQNKKSNKRKSKSTQQQKSAATAESSPSSTTTPEPALTLEGSYRLIDPPAARDRVTKAIEASVSDKTMFTKGTVRGRLNDFNFPPPEWITISLTPTEVTIETDQSESLKTSNGTSKTWPHKGYRFQVSTKWVNGSLERTFEGAGGLRTNTYSLSDNGKTLTMRVYAVSTAKIKLTQPLTYELSYQRR